MEDQFNVIYYNEEYLPTKSFYINITDRAFKYGDGLFETIHASGGNVQLFELHMTRLRKGLEILNIPINAIYTNNYILQCIQGVLHRCRLYQGATVRLSIWRKAEGKFLVNTTGFNILIEANYLSNGEYSLNSKGLTIDLYNETLINYNILSSVKSSNGLPYILAGIFAKKKNIDDALMMNISGCITEATSSNLFIYKDGIIYTPSLDSGCLPGTMRTYIINRLKFINIEVIETQITPSNIEAADEIFLTNAICGIKWIVAYKNKRFVNRLSRKLMKEINNDLIR